MISCARTLYLADDTATVLSLGTMDTLGLPARQYQLAQTGDLLAGGSWMNGAFTGDMLSEAGYVTELSVFGTDTGSWWLPGT